MRDVGQGPFGAVGVEAGDEVEGAGVEGVGDFVVLPVAGEQFVEEVEYGRRGRRLCGVDVAIGPVGGFFCVGAGAEVGDSDDPDVASFVAGAEAG